MFGFSVAISGDTDVIGERFDNDRGGDSGSGSVYTKIGGKWIENGKIVSENGTADDCFGLGGFSVAISGSIALFGAGVGNVISA